MRSIAIAATLLLTLAVTACTSDAVPADDPDAVPTANAGTTQAADEQMVGPPRPEPSLWSELAGSVLFLRQGGADSGALPLEGTLTVADGCLRMTLAADMEERAVVFTEGVEVREDGFTDRQGRAQAFGEPFTFSEEEVAAEGAPDGYVERCGDRLTLIGVGH